MPTATGDRANGSIEHTISNDSSEIRQQHVKNVW